MPKGSVGNETVLSGGENRGTGSVQLLVSFAFYHRLAVRLRSFSPRESLYNLSENNRIRDADMRKKYVSASVNN